MTRQPSKGDERLTVVVVTYNNRDRIVECLRAVESQLRDGDEVIVVDNASTDGTADAVAASATPVILLRNAANKGFAAAANQGAARASGELMLFLNPDVIPDRGAIDLLRAAKNWSVWQGLVTVADGMMVNSAGGALHYLGIAWAGHCGEPVAGVGGPQSVAFASGACLMTRRETWDELGGFPDDYFMYFEDVDLSLRARLAGGRVGIEPAARFRHDYEFDKGPMKWRLLERNRWFTVIRTYPGKLLAAVLPGLLVAEILLIAYAASHGWGRQKLIADAEVIAALPALLAQRRAIRARSPAGVSALLGHMVPTLDSPNIGRAGRAAPARMLLHAYWRMLRFLVRR